MKIAIFNGSPKENGNTSAVVDKLIPGLENTGCEVKTINLFPLEIIGCNNCGVCEEEGYMGECTIDDDMDDLYPIIKDSDLLIIASPIYMWQFTACTTAFLERLHCMQDSLEGKRVALVTTMGDDEFVASYAITAMMEMCNYFHMMYLTTFALPFADRNEINRPMYEEKLKDFINKITG